MTKPHSFEVERVSGLAVSDEELLADLQLKALATGSGTIGSKAYRTVGKYDDTTISRRFGSWNAALKLAGLAVSNEVALSDQVLFENLLNLWQHYGRQPRRAELAQPLSKVSQGPYGRRFGSWSAALVAFVSFANELGAEGPGQPMAMVEKRQTGREPSIRLRWHVLRRDRFTCRACGLSPATTPGTELHVDHVIAWSNGGETVLENLQTLCSTCNLGKSNL